MRGPTGRSAWRPAGCSASTRPRPVLLVFEDWHWADDASHGVLAQLASLAPAWRLALVITYRQAPCMDWVGSAPRREIRLGPLGAESTKILISSLLGAETASRSEEH